MEIIEATLDDIPNLVRARDADTGSSPADRRTLSYLAGEHHPGYALEPREIYFAREEELILGYIGGHLTTRYDCDGELQYLWVNSQRRRAGIGSALFARLAAWFRSLGAKKICVDVVPENDRARSFYKYHGAKELNTHWLVWDLAASPTLDGGKAS